jgi:uncharacterized protein (DUF924 family)
MLEPQAVLDYWLGDTQHDPDSVPEKSRMWYSSVTAVDQYIDDTFGEVLKLAEHSKLPSWLESPTGQLANVILLDQFTRNLNRGSKHAWKNDGLALAIAERCVNSKDYLRLSYFGRVFLYHPYHHAESVSEQEKAVNLFEELYDEASADWQTLIKGFVDFTKGHSEIIRRFGRFPHRNEALGRKSSKDEIAYLLENRRKYGQ